MDSIQDIYEKICARQLSKEWTEFEALKKDPSTLLNDDHPRPKKLEWDDEPFKVLDRFISSDSDWKWAKNKQRFEGLLY